MKVRAPVRHLREGDAAADAELVRYVNSVHHVSWGEPFVAFDPEQRTECDALLLRAADGAVMLRAGPLRPAAVVATWPLVLVQGLAKGDKCDAIVRDATELGATAIVITPMERSVARPAQAKLAERERRWQRIADEATRQSGRGDAPRIALGESLSLALGEAPAGAAKFVLFEGASTPIGPGLAAALAPDRRHGGVALVVGPEGGLADAEVELCQRCGFAPVSLGPFVLRTETVAAAVLGAVRVLEGAPGARR